MSDTTKELIMWLIPLAPLVSAVLTGLFGPKLLGERSHRLCCTALAVSFVCSVITLVSIVPPGFSGGDAGAFLAPGYEFLNVGTMHVRVDLSADAMTALMLVMVTGVSFLVAVFASSYMHGDPGYPRFFAAVSLFVFSMCLLVLSGNFIMLFAGWELVGLCSYLLIGFWFQKPSAAAAAKKAFVVNRIGDFGFILGIFLIWTTFGSVNFIEVLGDQQRIASIAAANPGLITTICLLLFLGAMGKSAQFPLQVWLPDAMEGPTPVSALIHAATMVTAGVYMVARCTPLFIHSPTAQVVVSCIGAITALTAALIALTQTDLKRVLAYSTVSQLGYMFMALGAGIGGAEAATFAVAAGMFHLYTHAFFKALLFLAAGSVMHSMGDVIDMRRFSGLRKVLPITHWTFLAGAAALAGIPLLAGFWSKDEIISVLKAATEHEQYGHYYKAVFAAALATALMTAFYTFRAYFMTFWGEERIPEEAGHHPHDAPPAMANPLRILAFFAIFIGLILGPTHLFLNYLAHTTGLVEVHAHMHLSVMLMSALIAGVGVAGAWFMYVSAPALPGQIASAIKPLYLLSLNKFYLDEIFWAILVAPLRALAWLLTLFDKGVLDGIVDGVGKIPRLLSTIPSRMHGGLIPSYALVMWVGVVVGVLLMIGNFW